MRRVPSVFLLAALTSLVAQPLAAQRLTSIERSLAGNVDGRADAAIALLERTVNINSGTLNLAGVRRVADLMAPEFEALGFTVRWVQLPDSVERAGHLIAERRGTRGKKLLLIGHLDTVFEEDSPFQQFERLDGDRASGPGVADMKGGNIVILLALQALHDAGALDGASITVILTGDEESPGRPLSVSRHDLIEAGRASDIALGFEGGSSDAEGEMAVIARRSSSSWRLDVTARTAHSSGIFRDGIGAGAIFEAARILDRFYAELRGERYLTFNVGAFLGGAEASWDRVAARGTAAGKTNIIPERAIAVGDLRTISAEQQERTRERMRRIVERSLPGAEARITFDDGYPAMPPTDANRALLDRFNEVSMALGYGTVRPFDPGGRGAADISFVAPYIEAGLDGLGPHGSGSHTIRETVDLASIPVAARRAAVLIYRLTR